MVTNDGKGESNDENFYRWGTSFYRRFFGFICSELEKGMPMKIPDLPMGKTFEGCWQTSENIRQALKINLKKFGTDGIDPPSHDPMKGMPPAYSAKTSKMAYLSSKHEVNANEINLIK